MTGIRRAQAAFEDAKRQAKKLIDDARLELGRQIVAAREGGVQQKDIGDVLSLTREQVRRLEVAAKKAAARTSSSDSSGESLE